MLYGENWLNLEMACMKKRKDRCNEGYPSRYVTGESTVLDTVNQYSIYQHFQPWISGSALIVFDKGGWGRGTIQPLAPLQVTVFYDWPWLSPMGEQLLIYTVSYPL
jgi:hypothetical protein